MTSTASGLLSDLVLVRMHGRAEDYLRAREHERLALLATCRNEATVPDLAERIVARTIYAQAASRSAPLRELVQNALDASPRGARIEIRLSEDGREILVSDQGPGMTRTELLEDLLVPFRSAKEGEPATIGEHGIGFFSALEIAPCVEVVSLTRAGAHRLRVEPYGEGPPYRDFTWSIGPVTRRGWYGMRGATGTTVRLMLATPTTRATLAADLATVVGLVDPAEARVYLNGLLVNTARSRLRRVATAPVGRLPGGRIVGDLTLYVGRGEGIEPQLTVLQKGLTVSARMDPFLGSELGLHRDLARAITTAGYGIVVELPLGVPLNKGRSAVAANASAAVETALTAAFERFMLGDALYDRELLRAVDHRMSSVLDRLIAAAMLGDPIPPVVTPPPPEGAARTPTVAAPEEVVRFASGLLDAPLFVLITYDDELTPTRVPSTLRQLIDAHRCGLLRPQDGRAPIPGRLHLPLDEPLAQALWRRLAVSSPQTVVLDPPSRPAPIPVSRTSRDVLLSRAGHLGGTRTVAGAMVLLEKIDAAISQSADLATSPVWIHQDLYGPDEMAHTDGSGISVNLASARVRALIASALASDDWAALSALVDLMLHEKAHVSLASFIPRAQAEHGTSFYRRKEWLRRRLLYAIELGIVADPMRWLVVVRRGLDMDAGGLVLPTTEALASALVEPLAGSAVAA
ncbi:ATP-binding protein [Chondromyces crocatus]|uniref:Heat-shock protein n=1 Tax=Chondromyces crocatus TaxID=52 RepID=A0A0K1EA21_CHOCO|nr:ATP-binding protein [Chondromyces crocatus]AKT37694.1 heat-shock protein [Chondromyces crocatus]